MCDWCGDGWRFEATELGGPNGGRVKAVLHAVGGDWENALSRASTGNLLLTTQEPSQEDIWSGATGVYVSQVLPDGSRKCHFGGYTEKANAAGGGALTLPLKSLDSFLDERVIAGPNDPYTLFIARLVSAGPPPPEQYLRFQIYKPASAVADDYDLVYQTAFTTGGYAALAAFLVELAKGSIEGGDPVGLSELSATWAPPYTDVDLLSGDETFAHWWEFKNIGTAIKDLVDRENGIQYRLDHSYANGYWSSLMTFSNRIGEDRDYTITSNREADAFALEVNAEEKATRVYGVGFGDEWDTLFSIAYDADLVDNLPERQSVQTWKDQTNAATLDALTRGYVADHRDPVTIPSVSLPGLPTYDPDEAGYDPQRGFPGPDILRVGDTFKTNIELGALTVRDLGVKALAIAWRLATNTTVRRTVAMQPLERANDSVRTQTPARVVSPVTPVPPVTTPPKADPWPTPGLLTTVKSDTLTEISGMEVSLANPGHAWVMNDEKENPQVSCVDLHTGRTYSTFTPSPGVSNAPVGDPEAIRMARVSKKLVLGDFGDNDADRPTSGPNQPHLLVLPEPKGNGPKGTLTATRLPIQYSVGGAQNAETLLIHPTTEEVLIVTKAATAARVFSFGPLSDMNTTNNVGNLVATLTDIDHVSDGCHLLAGGFVAFRSATRSETVIYKVTGTTWKKVGSIPTPPMKKSEAICAESRCAFLTSTEGEHAPIYRVLIPTAFGATCATQAGPSGGGTGGFPAATVPSQLLDFSMLKLTLPIGSPGSPKEIGPRDLTHGYEHPAYFYLKTAVEGVVFAAPVDGVTTENSHNPRSETRQLNSDGSPAAWSNANATWQMECELAFTHLPGDSDNTRGVVGMQCHDGQDDVTVLRLERSGELWVTKGDNTHFDKILNSYTLGTWMNVRLVLAKGGGAAWYLNGAQVAVVPVGVVEGAYFKFGAYVQRGPDSTGFGSTHVRKAVITKRNG